jgi:hypothetical protein
VRIGAGGVAELQRREAASMDGYVNGRRVSVEGLADHEHGLAMGIPAAAEEGDIRGEDNVSGDLLPDELEVVDADPHILAAATDRICALGGVILRGTGVEDGANILAALEDAKLLGLGLLGLGLQSKGGKREGGENRQLADGRKGASRHKQPLETSV